MSRHPAVNVFWIGPPSNKEDGHDECGIRSLVPRTSEETPFVFWCLQQYRDNFTSRFSNLPIRVETVEDFFYAHRNNHYFKRAVKIFEQTILAEGRNQNRDGISIKELTQLLVWYMRGGYAIDSNVFARGDSVNFPDYQACFLDELEMEGPRVEKKYGNSHIAKDRAPIPPAHFAAENDDLVALQAQKEINGIDETREFSNLTPLYASLFYQKTKAAFYCFLWVLLRIFPHS